MGLLNLFGNKDPKWYCRNCGYDVRSVEEPVLCPECREDTSFSMIFK